MPLFFRRALKSPLAGRLLSTGNKVRRIDGEGGGGGVEVFSLAIVLFCTVFSNLHLFFLVIIRGRRKRKEKGKERRREGF